MSKKNEESRKLMSKVSKCRKLMSKEDEGRLRRQSDMERSGERCKDKKAKAMSNGAMMRLLL
jgi:hypothetical protein